jgi:hypothetical protein
MEGDDRKSRRADERESGERGERNFISGDPFFDLYSLVSIRIMPLFRFVSVLWSAYYTSKEFV